MSPPSAQQWGGIGGTRLSCASDGAAAVSWPSAQQRGRYIPNPYGGGATRCAGGGPAAAALLLRAVHVRQHRRPQGRLRH